MDSYEGQFLKVDATLREGQVSGGIVVEFTIGMKVTLWTREDRFSG